MKKQQGKLLDFYCSGKKMEVGTEPEIRNTAEEQTKRAEELQRYKTSVSCYENLSKSLVTFYGTIHGSQTGTGLFQSQEEKKSPCHVTVRDSCTIPFKGTWQKNKQ